MVLGLAAHAGLTISLYFPCLDKLRIGDLPKWPTRLPRPFPEELAMTLDAKSNKLSLYKEV